MTSVHGYLAALAAVVLVSFLGLVAFRPGARAPWWAPALAALGFLGFSAYAVATDGPLGFWPVHARSAWGNQVWFDLLFAAAIAWLALLPRLRAVGMRPWAWALALAATGSIALLAMLARVTYLEGRARVA